MVFAFICSSAALSSLGAGVVRPAMGKPTARNISSSPAGEQIQSNRAVSFAAFVKKVRRICRNVDCLPCPHDGFFAAKCRLQLAFQDGKRFLEIVAVMRRAVARRNKHVNRAGQLLPLEIRKIENRGGVGMRPA